MNQPVIPRYGNGCITDLLAPLLGHEAESDAASMVQRTGKRVLVVLDGLGWLQMQQRPELTPTLSAMAGSSITTVAPSTTAAALTSITTGLAPGDHGVIGHRMVVDGEVLNTLRWSTPNRPDARAVIPPAVLQPHEPFGGRPMALVTKAEFATSGFSRAHLRNGRLTGYRTPATLVHEVGRLLHGNEDVVYAYWDGVDKVAHEYGIGSEYDAEVAFADRLVADIVAAVPAGTQVIVTADHGQVDCGDNLVPLADDVRSRCTSLSGEGRFRWLHCRPGDVDALATAAEEAHGHQAWVRTIDQIRDEHWFGPNLSPDVRDRLGEVALLPFEPIAFADPDDTGPFELVGRHGSLTAEEMLVPLVAAIT